MIPPNHLYLGGATLLQSLGIDFLLQQAHQQMNLAWILLKWLFKKVNMLVAELPDKSFRIWTDKVVQMDFQTGTCNIIASTLWEILTKTLLTVMDSQQLQMHFTLSFIYSKERRLF